MVAQQETKLTTRKPKAEVPVLGNTENNGMGANRELRLPSNETCAKERVVQLPV